jgi:hypothetical protein
MRYCVRDIEEKRLLADQTGILHFETVDDAKIGGIGAGYSFMVIEDEPPYHPAVYGLRAGNGFFFLEGTLQNRDTSREPEAVGLTPTGADQTKFRPLV